MSSTRSPLCAAGPLGAASSVAAGAGPLGAAPSGVAGGEALAATPPARSPSASPAPSPSAPAASSPSAPPAPFRAPAWHDHSLEHRPCSCPSCREAPRGRLMLWRLVLVTLAGVVLPLVSLVTNLKLTVVDLQLLGTVGLLVAVLATLANMVLITRRKQPLLVGGGEARRPGRQLLRTWAPRSSALRVVLLLGGLWSCLFWAYLSLLFLPIAPLSIIGLLYAGLGLCGLCPFFALAVSVVQAVRGVRSLTPRLGQRRTAVLVLAALVLPLGALGAAGGWLQLQRTQVAQVLTVVARTAPGSTSRMRAISQLAGMEQRLLEHYAAASERVQRAAAAEAYMRLTDEPLGPSAVRRTRGRAFAIRPWWFLDGADGPMWNGFFGRML